MKTCFETPRGSLSGILCSVLLLAGLLVATAAEVSPPASAVRDLTPLQDAARVLINPHKGWYHHYPDNHINKYEIARDADLLEFPGMDHLYIRLSWAYLEPKEGQYDWAVIDRIIEKWTAKGLGISFRISCKETSTDRIEQHYATPLWVKDAGAKGGYYWMGNAAGPDRPWEVDYGDPIFIAKVDKFLAAFAARYDGKPWLRYVDIGSVGDWGEGHTWAGSRKVLSYAVRKTHVDLYLKHFKRAQLVISDDYVHELPDPVENKRLHQYVLANGISYRDDSIMVDGNFSQFGDNFTVRSPEYFADAYKLTPTVMELEHYGEVKQLGNWEPRTNSTSFKYGKGKTGPDFFRGSIDLLHATYIGYHGYAREWLDDNPVLTGELLNRCGYWLFPKSIELPSTLVAGGKVPLTLTLENRGVAPPYAPYELRIKLSGAGTNVISVLATDCKSWLPGAPVVLRHELALPADLKAGSYEVAVGLFDVNQGKVRAVDFALKASARDSGGYYQLTKVPVTAASPAAPLQSRDLAPAKDGAFRFGPCHASLQSGLLRIGNGQIERTWRVESDGSLTANSLLDSALNLEWIGDPAPATPAAEPPSCTLTAESGQAGPTEEPSLRVTLRVRPDAGGPIYRFQLFANSAAIVADRSLAGPPAAGAATLEQLNRLESFTPAPTGWALTRVRIFDRTDLHAGPVVVERPGLGVTAEDANDSELIADGARFRGNVFFVEDPRTSAGILWLKHAALADERPCAINEKGAVVRQLYDLTVAHGQLMLDSHELDATGGQTYRTVSLVYQGGRAGRIAALQRYHRQMRAYEPGRDGLMLCNFWGEWNNNKNLNAPFLVREIDAAAKLGVDIFEIDAGWQRGGYSETNNKAKRNTLGPYGISPQYWDFHPKILPDGIKPLVAQSRAHGMQFGLWFPPDNVNELGAWEKDKARVLELHAEGVNYFKFDLLHIYTRRAEEHFQRLVEELINETGGGLTIDLDVTGGHSPRPGYFGNPHHGPIFVENRFTHYPLNSPEPTTSEFWPRKDRYFPHCTLRNLWLLAQYYDPVRLRMEFMNNLRNQNLYGDDPLAPAHWSPDYVFATVMCSSPLAWMEVAQLPPVYVEKVAPLVAIWKAHREAMFRGDLIPIGAEPDGHAWTGFFSAAPDRTGGYALLFREDNDRSSFELPLPLLKAGNFEVTTLAGQGTAKVKGDRLHVELPAARSFVFLKLQRK